MTLWVTRDADKIEIHGNINLDVEVKGSQVREFVVREHHMHVRHFAGQLLEAIKEAEAEAERLREREARDL